MRRPTRRSIFGSRVRGFGRSRRRPTPSSILSLMIRRPPRPTPSSNRRSAQRNAMSAFNRLQSRATSRSRARPTQARRTNRSSVPTQARRRSRPSLADIYKRSSRTRRRNTGLRDRRMSPTQARRSRSPLGRRLASNRRAIGRIFNRRRR